MRILHMLIVCTVLRLPREHLRHAQASGATDTQGASGRWSTGPSEGNVFLLLHTGLDGERRDSCGMDSGHRHPSPPPIWPITVNSTLPTQAYVLPLPCTQRSNHSVSSFQPSWAAHKAWAATRP
eukprot:GGOE01013400.1.p2 GENE.GGOE01013400.1~~GGOE01013400.1.p2  ORF type:complete len:124 (-),score=1.46 GGOE01013400.1:45-416(-)